jgi:hypothetical protein
VFGGFSKVLTRSKASLRLRWLSASWSSLLCQSSQDTLSRLAFAVYSCSYSHWTTMLRSLVSVFLGGCLCLLATCAGNVVLPPIVRHLQPQHEEPATQTPVVVRSDRVIESTRVSSSLVALERYWQRYAGQT